MEAEGKLDWILAMRASREASGEQSGRVEGMLSSMIQAQKGWEPPARGPAAETPDREAGREAAETPDREAWREAPEREAGRPALGKALDGPPEGSAESPKSSSGVVIVDLCHPLYSIRGPL